MMDDFLLEKLAKQDKELEINLQEIKRADYPSLIITTVETLRQFLWYPYLSQFSLYFLFIDVSPILYR